MVCEFYLSKTFGGKKKRVCACLHMRLWEERQAAVPSEPLLSTTPAVLCLTASSTRPGQWENITASMQ